MKNLFPSNQFDTLHYIQRKQFVRLRVVHHTRIRFRVEVLCGTENRPRRQKCQGHPEHRLSKGRMKIVLRFVLEEHPLLFLLLKMLKWSG